MFRPTLSTRFVPVLAAVLSAGALVAGSAQARPAPASRATGSPAVQAVFDCRKLTDDAARLACYDRAAGALDQAQTQGQVVVIDRDQAKTVRREAFGFNLPSLNVFNHAIRDEPVDRVEVALAGAHRNGDGRWVLVTDADQVWRQIETEDMYNDPKAGAKMTIKRGALGSYFCKVDAQSAFRCTRER